MSDLNAALDTTIAAAVTARVEAEVVAALSGDEVIGQYVAAALREPVETTRNYRTEKVPYLRHVLTKTFQDVAKEAVARVLEEERPTIEEEVRKAVKREAGTIAEGVAGALAKRASSGYGVSIDLNLAGDA